MGKKSRLEGRKQGRLTVIEKVEDGETWGQDKWRCRCDCGREVIISAAALKCKVDSCGCLRQERAKAWMAQKRREAAQAASAEGQQAPKKVRDEWAGSGTEVKPEIFALYMHERDKYPGWWHRCLNVVIDEMCNMMARGRHTDMQLARLWKCPISFVQAVRLQYAGKISRTAREYLRLQKMYEAAMAKAWTGDTEASPENGVALLMRALMDDGEKDGGQNEY